MQVFVVKHSGLHPDDVDALLIRNADVSHDHKHGKDMKKDQGDLIMQQHTRISYRSLPSSTRSKYVCACPSNLHIVRSRSGKTHSFQQRAVSEEFSALVSLIRAATVVECHFHFMHQT
jgi:hypothetical protein